MTHYSVKFIYNSNGCNSDSSKRLVAAEPIRAIRIKEEQ